MKSLRNLERILKDELFTSGTADLYAYMAYCQGFAEGKAFKTVLTVFGGNDWQADKADKMQVYPDQLKKEYSPEELKEIKTAMMRNLNEEERKAEFARQVEELKQNPTSVLHAIAMQKAAERVEEK